jgi:GTP cyclohydrolase I
VGVEAAHMCAMMRGVHKSEVRMQTWSYLGAFKDNPALQAEVSFHKS